jgi:hypothetical protein
MRNDSEHILTILAYLLIGFATVMAVSVIAMLVMGAGPAVIHLAPLVAAGGGLLLLRKAKRTS